MITHWQYYSKYNTADEISLITNGNEFYFQLEDAINKAKQKINLQYYIFDYDNTGKAIVDAIIRAAKRGIKVYILLDAFGSKAFPKHIIEELKYNGVFIRFFSPIFSFNKISVGRRLHHKLAVIDWDIVFVGGINISDKYRDTDKGKGWLDFAVKINGNVAEDCRQICKYLWTKRATRKHLNKINNEIENKILVKVSENDWFTNKNKISSSYKRSIRNAEKSITIVGAYFLPGRQFRNLLKKASDKGIQIRIILSRTSDISLMLHATRFLYDWMFRNNIKIYEWKDSVVHGKVAIVDDEWTTVGSFNLNYLSLFGSLELNLDIFNKKFSTEFNNKIDEIIENGCIQITEKNYKKEKNIFSQIKLWSSYQTLRLSMILAVLLTTKPEQSEDRRRKSDKKN